MIGLDGCRAMPGSMRVTVKTICYLAPELTALEATFVYQELLALESRGVKVVPVSIRRPSKYLVGHDDLLDRTIYLYEAGGIATISHLLRIIFRFRPSYLHGLRYLFSDMRKVGFLRLQSWKLFFQYMMATRLADILTENHCQHLHIHFAHVSAQIGMYASAMTGVPFTVMAHANDIFERGLLLAEKAERSLKFLTISEFNRRYLEGQGVDPGKLAVVRCGVSFRMRPMPEMSSRNGVLRIGTLGRLVEKKGIDVLVRAVAKLKSRGASLSLSVAGDGPLLVPLKQLAEELDVADDVIFEGALPHARVSEWMQGLDVFVLACKPDANGDMDGIPVALMEAMSQAVPVVSSRMSGIPELVIHEQTGLLSTSGDADDLADKIQRFLDSGELRLRLAQAAQLHLSNEFGQDVNLNRLQEYFGSK